MAKKDQETVPWIKQGEDKLTDTKPVHYTLIIRLPFPRGDFIDPPPVSWDATKDRKLWKVISKLSNNGGASSTSASEGGANSDVDWDAKAAEFGVDTRFLLQQAAWLWERHREHVKKHFVRVRAGSTAGTPVPGQASILGKKPMPSSRAPSSLSVRSRDSPLPRIDTTAASAVQARPSTLSRTPSGATVTQSRQLAVPPSPRSRTLKAPMAGKKSSTALKSPSHADTSPTISNSSSEASSSSDDVQMSRSHAAFRRPPRFGAKRKDELTKLGHDGDDEEDESNEEDEEPIFYSTTQLDGNAARPEPSIRDLGDTLREPAPPTPNDPTRARAESIKDAKASSRTTDAPLKHMKTTKLTPAPQQHISKATTTPRIPPTESSASSLSSVNAPNSAPRTNAPARQGTHPLSPHRADLARVSSPRRGELSDGTPSMGSSFSDLDVDASVTQSALEEALASNLRNGGSRLSNISNAFRSRYM